MGFAMPRHLSQCNCPAKGLAAQAHSSHPASSQLTAHEVPGTLAKIIILPMTFLNTPVCQVILATGGPKLRQMKAGCVCECK